LPVNGSEWYVNIYPCAGGHFAHKLVEIRPNDSKKFIVLIDRGRMAAAGLPPEAPASVALSLGGEAPTLADPRIVSNVVPLVWAVR
jgi:hypothetical protein